MKTEKLIEKIVTEKVITESEINLLKRRLNTGEKINMQFVYDNDIKITPEQTNKGISFLVDQWKTPKGIERKNNPFGYREQDAIETFKAFYFNGFYDCSRYGQRPWYVPVYIVCGKDCSFEYYYNFNGVQIIG
jgi:hypothetical protein